MFKHLLLTPGCSENKLFTGLASQQEMRFIWMSRRNTAAIGNVHANLNTGGKNSRLANTSEILPTWAQVHTPLKKETQTWFISYNYFTVTMNHQVYKNRHAQDFIRSITQTETRFLIDVVHKEIEKCEFNDWKSWHNLDALCASSL